MIYCHYDNIFFLVKLGHTTMTTYSDAISALEQGDVIACPTEAVYGLSCDPFNQHSVEKILRLKQRPVSAGLILIGASWEQLQPLTQSIPAHQLQEVLSSWPGNNTWVFPASKTVPHWITGDHHTVALRVPDHALARQICDNFQSPLVSTSANPRGEAPARSAAEVLQYFSKTALHVVEGEVGGYPSPSTIRHTLSGEVLR